MQTDGPNAEQIELWNRSSGERWVAGDSHLARTLAAIGDALIERAAPRPTERVLDVGCGAGHTTFAIGQAVTERGSVVGVDISAPLLALASDRAKQRGLAQVGFLQADAQIHDFGTGVFDLVCSRFGVMFFADPTAAFANLATATANGGRLVFACWRTLMENPWFAEPFAAMAEHIEPPPPPKPGGPGPFAFADEQHVRSILERAGWADVRLEAADTTLWMGDDVDDALRFASEVGPTAVPLAQADASARTAALAQMRKVFASNTDASGAVRMRAALWYVRAARTAKSRS
jgi:SAM-dependent methyltransferase